MRALGLGVMLFIGLATGVPAGLRSPVTHPHAPKQAVASFGWRWASVHHVTDGDTVWVRFQGEREPVKLRLQGMDAPELCQFWGVESRAALAGALPLGRWVAVRRLATDLYGREVAEVWAGGVSVSAWMVSEGHAWADERQARLMALQRSAQMGRRGLFGTPAVRPQDFRRWRGTCQGT